jgi:hypothetical protein
MLLPLFTFRFKSLLLATIAAPVIFARNLMAATNVPRGSASASSMETQQAAQPRATEKTEANDQGLLLQSSNSSDPEGQPAPPAESDVFGNEEGADVQYKTCEW